jgi:DNA replication and repair protein RecF
VECSTGEQKALLLAIILAHAGLLALGRGQPPLLLLDEVAAHLDRSLRGALFGEVLSLNCQAWLSGTDAALFDDLQGVAQYLDVRDAVVSRQLNRVPAGT